MKAFIRNFVFLLWGICSSAVAQVTVATDDAGMPLLDLSVVGDGASNLTGRRSSVAYDDAWTWAGRLQSRLDSLCQDPLFDTSVLGLCVYDLSERRMLYATGCQQRLRPASNQKLVTAIAALHTLGVNYELKTQVCLSGEVKDGVLEGNVYLVGGMDPLLSHDDLASIVTTLRQAHIDSIAGQVCADLSAKDDKDYGSGWCWDDNYGPLSALMLDAKADIAADFVSALSKQNIKLQSADMVVATCSEDARCVLTISHPLTQLLIPMMKDSDNIMAESLFYQLAFHAGKKGAGAKEAIACIDSLVVQLGVDPHSYEVADGSGLSLYNFVTADMLLRLLNFAYDQPHIYNALTASLPIASVDGTLKRRLAGTSAAGKVRAKTGSVTSVSSLSGYAMGGNGHMLSFSIINQGVERVAHGRDFQNRVCVALCDE